MNTVHEDAGRRNTKQENPLLLAALARAEEGWAVHPLWGIITRGGVRQCECSAGIRCEKPGKHGRLTGWQDAATQDPQKIQFWWKLYPHANIGAHTGKKSGRNVLDTDPQNGGTISREALEEEHGALPDTQQTITGGGGLHDHFLYDGPLKNSVGALGAGLDIRSDGGNLVLPGSLHISGGTYEYEVTHGPDDVHLAEMPAWLRAKLSAQTNGHHKPNAEGEPIHDGQRNDTLFKLACSMRARGCSHATILSALRAENEARCNPPLDENELEKIATSSSKYEPGTRNGVSHTFQMGEDEDEALPEIIVNNRPLRHVSDDSVGALLKKNAPPALYVRSGRLVRRLHDEHMRPMLDTLTEAALCGFLTRSAEFLKRTTNEENGTVKDVHVPPPLPVVRDVYSLGSWSFPALIGLTECPVLRPDGTVCSGAGYDAATRLLYDPAPGLIVSHIPDFPSEADARRAAQYILTELFSDFPFCDPADLANMMGCLLTPIVRPAIPGNVPLCLIDKPAPGSGATLLSDLVSIVATGEHAAKLLAPVGRDAENEWRKKVTALLDDGSPVAVIDNVEDALGSSALSVLLTSSRWKDRILGKTETITLPVRVCLIATANNISVRGDLARRCYRVRIDAQEERPWTRTEFRHPDLLNWTRTHRGEILACLLTMARAWFAAKQPKADVSTLGMFEQWTHTIGGILAFSGVPGFLTNLDELYELVDDEGPAWAAFLKALHVYFQDKWFTTAKIANATGSEMYGAIPDSIGWDESKAASSRTRLGKAFLKRADRVYAGVRLERNREKDTIQNTAQWRIVQVTRSNPGKKEAK